TTSAGRRTTPVPKSTDAPCSANRAFAFSFRTSSPTSARISSEAACTCATSPSVRYSKYCIAADLPATATLSGRAGRFSKPVSARSCRDLEKRPHQLAPPALAQADQRFGHGDGLRTFERDRDQTFVGAEFGRRHETHARARSNDLAHRLAPLGLDRGRQRDARRPRCVLELAPCLRALFTQHQRQPRQIGELQ